MPTSRERTYFCHYLFTLKRVKANLTGEAAIILNIHPTFFVPERFTRGGCLSDGYTRFGQQSLWVFVVDLSHGLVTPLHFLKELARNVAFYCSEILHIPDKLLLFERDVISGEWHVGIASRRPLDTEMTTQPKSTQGSRVSVLKVHTLHCAFTMQNKEWRRRLA